MQCYSWLQWKQYYKRISKARGRGKDKEGGRGSDLLLVQRRHKIPYNMKKLKKPLSNIELIILLIGRFFVNCYGYPRNIWLANFGSIRRPRVLYGYHHWESAKRLCDRRTKNWKAKYDQLGGQSGVFPYGNESLLVASKLELKRFQKLGGMSRDRNYTKYFRKAYYVTPKK